MLIICGVLLVNVIDVLLQDRGVAVCNVLLQDRGVAVCTVLLHGGAAVCTAHRSAATSASRSSASMRASAAEKRASTACVDVSSSKIESARRLVWRVRQRSSQPALCGGSADQRIALLPAMHTEERLGGRPRLAGPPLTAPRPEVDGGELAPRYL
jgi:hypothetical protein